MSAGEERMLLHGIAWETYQRLVTDLEASPSTRLAFDRGALEVTRTSFAHERIKSLLGSAICFYTVEAAVPLRSGGSATLARASLARGIDPDLCFWVQSEAQARAGADVPPDLAIEVELTRSGVDRLAIYAVLGVGEVWRHDGQALTVSLLRGDRHEEAAKSVCFPHLPLPEVVRLGEARGTASDTDLLRAFVDRVRAGFPGA